MDKSYQEIDIEKAINQVIYSSMIQAWENHMFSQAVAHI